MYDEFRACVGGRSSSEKKLLLPFLGAVISTSFGFLRALDADAHWGLCGPSWLVVSCASLARFLLRGGGTCAEGSRPRPRLVPACCWNALLSESQLSLQFGSHR